MIFLIAEDLPEIASFKKKKTTFRENVCQCEEDFLVVLDMIICGRLVCLAKHLLEMCHNVGPSFAPLEPLPQKQPPVEHKKM